MSEDLKKLSIVANEFVALSLHCRGISGDPGKILAGLLAKIRGDRDAKETTFRRIDARRLLDEIAKWHLGGSSE